MTVGLRRHIGLVGDEHRAGLDRGRGATVGAGAAQTTGARAGAAETTDARGPCPAGATRTTDGPAARAAGPARCAGSRGRPGAAGTGRSAADGAHGGRGRRCCRSVDPPVLEHCDRAGRVVPGGLVVAGGGETDTPVDDDGELPDCGKSERRVVVPGGRRLVERRAGPSAGRVGLSGADDREAVGAGRGGAGVAGETAGRAGRLEQAGRVVGAVADRRVPAAHGDAGPGVRDQPVLLQDEDAAERARLRDPAGGVVAQGGRVARADAGRAVGGVADLAVVRGGTQDAVRRLAGRGRVVRVVAGRPVAPGVGHGDPSVRGAGLLRPDAGARAVETLRGRAGGVVAERRRVTAAHVTLAGRRRARPPVRVRGRLAHEREDGAAGDRQEQVPRHPTRRSAGRDGRDLVHWALLVDQRNNGARRPQARRDASAQEILRCGPRWLSGRAMSNTRAGPESDPTGEAFTRSTKGLGAADLRRREPASRCRPRG